MKAKMKAAEKKQQKTERGSILTEQLIKKVNVPERCLWQLG